MSTSQNMLELTGLTRHFGDFVAVDGIDLDIPRGEFMTLLGPSGSGKSTTLYMIAGFDQPTAGEVRIDGRSVVGVPPNRRNVGMVFQRYSLFPHMNVRDNVAFPLSVRGYARDRIRERVDETLKLVRLEDFANRKPAALSGGQQQRVALARALVYEPRILLMDEPLSALDRKLRDELQHEIRALHGRIDTTIIYVTHDQEEALRLSDRIAVFNNGRIVQLGDGEALYKQPNDSFVASFIGTSSFLVGEVEAVDGGRMAVRVNGDGEVAHAPACDGLAAGAPVLLMVRPEKASVSEERPEGEGNALRGTIREATFLGDNVAYVIDTAAGTELRVKDSQYSTAPQTLRSGTECWVSWAVDDTHAFADWQDSDIAHQVE